MLNKKALLAAILAGPTFLAGAAHLEAQDKFPSKPIVVIASCSPGCGADIIPRRMAAVWEEVLGVPVVVENRPGGGTTIGARHFLTLPADGYTLYSVGTPWSVVDITTGMKEADLTKMQALGQVGADVTGIVVTADSPFESVDDLIAAAKSGTVKTGGPPVPSTASIIVKFLESTAKVNFTYVSFGGSGEVMAEMLGGRLDFGVFEPSEVWSQIESGKMRYLAMATETRAPFLPDVPTLKEKGFDMVYENWRGFMTQKGVPADRVAVLEQSLKAVYNSPEWQKSLNDNYMVDRYLKADAFQAQIEQYHTKLGDLVTRLGLAK